MMLSKWNKIVLIGSLSLFQVSTAFAQTKKKKKAPKHVEETSDEAPTYQAHYGMAGCGLGSLIIKDDDTWPQVGSGLLNGLACQIGICQTFAISSNTMNCVEDNSSMAFVTEKEVFAQVNLDDMKKEAVQGQGEHLRAYADMLGCSGESDVALFEEISKTQYATIYATDDHKAVVKSYDRILGTHPTLKNSCTRVSAQS